MRKIIENLSHHLDDYECMWNGIEDIYMNKTGEKLPDQFFFAMSGFCSFAYIKTNNVRLEWIDQIVKKILRYKCINFLTV